NIINLKKGAAKYLLAIINSKDVCFEEVFNQYVSYGIDYIQFVYNVELLENEKVCCLEDKEEAFFLYMRKANLVKFSEDKKYLHYLRKALDIYPYMNDGIKLLLNEFKESQYISEMDKYKKQVKETIRILIGENKIEDANKFIREYEKIVCDDPEIEKIKKVMFL
ncbi:hypothetical protein D9O40_02545, partial [Clostridium autoethanogenum]